MPNTRLALSWQWPSAHPTSQLTTYGTSVSSSSQLASSLPSLRALCRAGSSHSVSGSWIRSSESWAIGGPGPHSCPRPVTGRRAALDGAARRFRNSPVSNAHSNSSKAAQPCPLHACLLRYGITDLAAFSASKQLALSQEMVRNSVEPKLAALAAEGLGPKQIPRLLRYNLNSILACSYSNRFQPNLELMQQMARYCQKKQDSKTQLSGVGKLLTGAPRAAVRYLSRDPSKVQLLLQLLESSLGVGLEQLAACPKVCDALCTSAEAADAMCVLLLQQGVPSEQVARMFMSHPTLFNYSAGQLSARLRALQQHLTLDAAAALHRVVRQPGLVTVRLEASLPPLLRFLDGYMGEEGAGRKLVLAKPVLGAATVTTAERTVGSLAA